MRKCLRSWRKLPEIMQDVREKTKRKEKWFSRVKEIIPNFEPIIE